MILINAKIFNGDNFISEDAVIIRGDKIEKVLSSSSLTKEDKENQEIVDIKGQILSPGFIDLQINGCGGVMFNDEITVDTMKIMNETNKKFGCTSFLPTLITSPDKKIYDALELIANLENKEDIGVLGLHIEGPYISLGKKGIHRPDYIRVLDDAVVEAIANVGYDGIKIMTIAPENALEKHLKLLNESGIKLAIGHTNATYDECMEKGSYYKSVTHLFNAMREFGSREPGVMGYIFEQKNLNTGIIVDGKHVSWPSVRVAKDILKEKLYLVTDALSPAGTDLKELLFEGVPVIYEDGVCFRPGGSIAGSGLMMIKGVENLVEKVGIDIEESLRMATSYPAKSIDVGDRYGYIKEGYIADITYFDTNDGKYKVNGTIAKGILNRY